MKYEAAKAFILDKLANELADNLHYHGVHHTLDVLEIVEELCVLEGVEGESVVLLQTAALFHDSGFMVSGQNHEALGCGIARAALPEFDYTARQIDLICGMIMATKIPQSPQNHLEKIICDADLDYLGRADFYTIGDSLFKELTSLGVLSSVEQWNRIQVKFLEGHFFHTNTNIARRAPIKQGYLDELRQIVATYES